ncbi:hypothetical protein [Spirosoma fluviale]|uniref:DUF5683 domain-containing protein n=1 Tax=Spirosoma fluviale TaxID=1597977 RepID=A0A286GVU5_9BACT|nr:hypothetical protein [Spirosoma fluviale]SOD99658.1 hypothetical protein SAMN06269250_0097 [Spirosoma fluviale]
MRQLLLLIACVSLAGSGLAQERVRNVRIRVADSSRIEVFYDLLNTRSGDSVFLDVRSRLRGTLRILPQYVSGDVGTRLTAGSDHRIVWEALANGYSLNEDIQARVLVKARISASGNPIASTPPPATKEPPAAPKVVVTTPVLTEARPEVVPAKPVAKAEPIPVSEKPPVRVASEPLSPQKSAGRAKPSIFSADTIAPVVQSAPAVVTAPVAQEADPPKKPASQAVETETLVPAGDGKLQKIPYKGPAWALLSAVAPGVGNIFVQTPKSKIGLRPLVTVGVYGLLIYGFMERTKSQDAYAIYEQQKNREAGEPYYQTANGHHQRYFLATRGALVVAAADVVLTFIKGLRNSQIQKEAKRFKSLMLRPGLQAGQPTAVVRYSF